MTDISKCYGAMAWGADGDYQACPDAQRNRCWRFLAPSDPVAQAYVVPPDPGGGPCTMFWPVDQPRAVRKPQLPTVDS